jgi:hypothetical protein
MIGRNPAAFEFPHLNLFVGDTLEGMASALLDPVQNHGLLRALAYIYGSEQTIISIGMARRWLFRRLSWTTDRVFDELRSRIAPRRLVDKSATYSQSAQSLERIRKMCPDAYYVHVVEHPATPGAVAALVERRGALDRGQRRAGVETQTSPIQLQWLSAQSLISAATNRVPPERRTVLRMERLLVEPHAELSALCARLGLPNDEAAVAEMLHPENSPFARLGPVGANLGDDPEFLRDPTFPPKNLGAATVTSDLLPEVAQLATRFGYE